VKKFDSSSSSSDSSSDSDEEIDYEAIKKAEAKLTP
jgi:hypothetical protein